MPKRKRRANGEGTIFRRKSGQWVVALTVERLDGTRRRVFRNAKSAEHGRMILSELMQKFHFSAPQAAKLTVGQLVERWIGTVKGEQSTIDSYRRAVDMRINPLLGQRRCDLMSLMVVEDWVAEMARSNVGLRSQGIAFAVLDKAFRYGLKRRLVTFNPCDEDIRPKMKRPTIRPFSEREVKAILRDVEGHRFEALHHLAFSAGLRQGELFGLQWPDIDWNNSTISIERQAKDYKGHVEIKSPKTESSRRTIDVTPDVIEKLKGRRKIALKEGHYDPQGFVFTSTEGTVIRRTNFGRRHWRSLLKRLKIVHRGYHHVRHTAATTMLREGTPVHVVAQILGHSDPTTTHRTYCHKLPGDGKIAVANMAKAMSRMTS